MADFEITKIPKDIFKEMQGKSFPEDCWVTIDDLELLKIKYHNFEGETKEGQLICNKFISKDIIEIFKKLYEANYQIASIELVDKYDGDDIESMKANNCSSFNFRKIQNTDKLSKHAMGLAIDINPLQNPVVYEKDNKTLIYPEEASKYANRLFQFPYKIDENDLAYKLFKEKNFVWGGEWDNPKDYQHFEVNDEFLKILYPNFKADGSFEDNAEAGGERTKKIVPIYQTKVFLVIFLIIFIAILMIGAAIGLTGYGG